MNKKSSTEVLSFLNNLRSNYRTRQDAIQKELANNLRQESTLNENIDMLKNDIRSLETETLKDVWHV